MTLSYAGQTESVVLGSTTFTNDRQKASVTVKKVDDTTENPISGGIYGLYAAEDIKNADGTVVVNKDTFIEKITTGAEPVLLALLSLGGIAAVIWYMKKKK